MAVPASSWHISLRSSEFELLATSPAAVQQTLLATRVIDPDISQTNCDKMATLRYIDDLVQKRRDAVVEWQTPDHRHTLRPGVHLPVLTSHSAVVVVYTGCEE